MTLALPGQPRAEALLRAALIAPAHAYLLHGPPGTGKRDAARAFTAALLGCDARRVVTREAAQFSGRVIIDDQHVDRAVAARLKLEAAM